MNNGYSTVTFNEVFESAEQFKHDYENAGIETTINETSIKNLYYLLVARYGNSPIANKDENQFKLKIFAITFQYGPAWEKRLKIQKQVRDLKDDELFTGAVNINNQSYNPGTDPSSQANEELGYINQQIVNKHKRSKLDAYQYLWDLIRTDVTEEFIKKFSICFKLYVAHTEYIAFSDEDCEE